MRISRRFKAIALGVLVGLVAVFGFGPLVRRAVADRAERLGATVAIDSVVPRFDGVSLRGVEVRLDDVPGVVLWLPRVDVGWDRKLPVLSGGVVRATGPMDRLVAQVVAWRARHRSAPAAKASTSAAPLRIDDFEVEWRREERTPTRTAHAQGVSVRKVGDAWSFAARALEMTWAPARWTARDLVVELRRDEDPKSGEASYRLARLGGAALQVAASWPSPPAAASLGSAAPSSPAPAATTQPVASPSADETTEDPDPAAVPDPGGWPSRMRSFRRFAEALTSQLEPRLTRDAVVDVRGAAADLRWGTQRLRLGPGKLSVVRGEQEMVVGLSADDATKAEDRDLLVELVVPREGGDGPSPPPLRARVVGGPISLSLLGLKPGDLGLIDLERSSLEAHVEVALAADGTALSVDGRGKVHDLAIENEKLAAAPLTGLELAWRGKAEVDFAAQRVAFPEFEIDLGALRFIAKGTIRRWGRDAEVDVSFDIPLVGCQSVFESIPEAMVPLLSGVTFAGSMSAVGHARFDTRSLDENYDVDWQGTLGCRIVSVPPSIDIQRYRGSFQKTVYTPQREPRSMTFGPDAGGWVPFGATSRFMEAAVLTTEDGGFHRHGGFSQAAIINSLRENLRARTFRRGASTISMQVAKNLYLPRTKHLSRKLQEAILTLYLEQVLTKREILEFYFNIIEYGPMVYGLRHAARHYFNSRPGALSLSQSLYLASILPSPNKHHFGAGGAVTAGRMRYLRTLMRIMEKRGRINEDELALGLRETVVFGAPSPHVAPPDDDDDEADRDDAPERTVNPTGGDRRAPPTPVPSRSG